MGDLRNTLNNQYKAFHQNQESIDQEEFEKLWLELKDHLNRVSSVGACKVLIVHKSITRQPVNFSPDILFKTERQCQAIATKFYTHLKKEELLLKQEIEGPVTYFFISWK